MTNKNLTIGLVVVAIVAIIGLFFPNAAASVLGGVTNYDTISGTGLQIGSGCADSNSTCTGTTMSQIYSGSCVLVSNSSIAATSTGTGTCAISGLLAGDKVFVSIATTTTEITRQFAVLGAIAGTDSATIRLANLTGAASTPGSISGFGSTTNYWVVR